MPRLATGLVLFLTLVTSASGQSSDPSWLDDLTFQAESQIQCKISYLLRVHEGELGGQKTYEARVQCEDGRQFDAQRIGEIEQFTFKACEVQVC